MIKGTDLIRFTTHSDDRGSLIAIENNKDIPFSIGRIYYIYGVDGNSVRGKHAHIDLKQVLICMKGSCKVLLYNGAEKEVVCLDSPEVGIYIYGFVWREMFDFSPDCVLMALVDKGYNPEDYIYDIEKVTEFAKREGEKK